MGDDTGKTLLELVAEILDRHGVEFIVVGGQAEVLLGSPRVTFDVDLCYRRTRENLRRLAEALGELRPKLRGAPEDLPFRIDPESLALGCNFAFATPFGDLVLLGYLEPLGGFEAIAERAETVRLEAREVRIIALDDLIAIKEFLGRPKDRQALYQLRAIRELRGRSQAPKPSPG